MDVTNVCDVERSPNDAGTNPKVRAISFGITKLAFQVTMRWMRTFVPMIAYVAHGVLISLRFVAIGNIPVYGQFQIRRIRTLRFVATSRWPPEYRRYEDRMFQRM